MLPRSILNLKRKNLFTCILLISWKIRTRFMKASDLMWLTTLQKWFTSLSCGMKLSMFVLAFLISSYKFMIILKSRSSSALLSLPFILQQSMRRFTLLILKKSWRLLKMKYKKVKCLILNLKFWHQSTSMSLSPQVSDLWKDSQEWHKLMRKLSYWHSTCVISAFLMFF